jgi:hypothetical protein
VHVQSTTSLHDKNFEKVVDKGAFLGFQNRQDQTPLPPPKDTQYTTHGYDTCIMHIMGRFSLPNLKSLKDKKQ